jgi:hypothetical protein
MITKVILWSPFPIQRCQRPTPPDTHETRVRSVTRVRKYLGSDRDILREFGESGVRARIAACPRHRARVWRTLREGRELVSDDAGDEVRA